MITIIYTLEDSGRISEVSQYSLPPKAALIAYIEQSKGNYHTWDYPADLDGIYHRFDRYYFRDEKKQNDIWRYPKANLCSSKISN